MAQNLNQVPPELEVWDVAGTTVLVRAIPDTEPPIYLFWRVESSEDREALGIKKVDRKFSTWGQFGRTGALNLGSSRELANTTEDPWDQIVSNYETEVRVKPWLAEPDVLALWMGAAMEGRSITEAELQGTEWWQTHTESERQWLSMNASDPATADALIADNRIKVADLLAQAGVGNANADLVNRIADNWTTGAWSEVYSLNQVRLLADPNLTGTLDATLANFRDGLDTTTNREDDVRASVDRWLGPAMASHYGDDYVAKWASRLRENPDANQELEEQLRNQFRTHINVMRDGKRVYGEDPNLTYEDVAAPWRGVWQQEWGQVADESDDLFMRMVRTNDVATAQRLLREEGLSRGNKTVGQRLLSDIGRAFGGQVRPADQAI